MRSSTYYKTGHNFNEPGGLQSSQYWFPNSHRWKRMLLSTENIYYRIYMYIVTVVLSGYAPAGTSYATLAHQRFFKRTHTTQTTNQNSKVEIVTPEAHAGWSSPVYVVQATCRVPTLPAARRQRARLPGEKVLACAWRGALQKCDGLEETFVPTGTTAPRSLLSTFCSVILEVCRSTQ